MVCADGRKFSILTLILFAKNDPILDYFCPKKNEALEGQNHAN